mmetsp:Transcript_95707/g.172652  ORF Transcript_95707/g.172652 Transcript_95707/m.172652 type:complete len:329 (-) Transcript_95707:16-1002(-)
MNPGDGLQAELLEAALIADEQRSCSIADLRGRRRSQDAVGEQRIHLCKALEGGSWPDSLILRVHACRLTLRALHGQRDDLRFELASLSRCLRALVGGHSELLDVLPAETVLLPEHFCPGKLREGLVAHAVLLEPLELFLVLLEHRVRHRVAMACFHAVDDASSDGHCGHGFHTASNDDVVDAAHHRLGSGVDRLLRGAALPVDRLPRHALRKQARGKHDISGDVPCLSTHLTHAAEDHILHKLWVGLGSLDEGVADRGPQVGWVVARQSPILLAAGRPAGVDDVGGEGLEIRHGSGIKRCCAQGYPPKPITESKQLLNQKCQRKQQQY